MYTLYSTTCVICVSRYVGKDVGVAFETRDKIPALASSNYLILIGFNAEYGSLLASSLLCNRGSTNASSTVTRSVGSSTSKYSRKRIPAGPVRAINECLGSGRLLDLWLRKGGRIANMMKTIQPDSREQIAGLGWGA